ncbi:uncharacterized protein BDZ83DRAFT_650070 [Colletotrichum acutatum]|uniref:Uncharacterized protein n=1 Tax=Glomerella acutata TaxID=27357 RepID=A0AAD8USL7_GLOAC|nr:uncharacterized protein BDZ83DRAFT_650070 [Colletotrichum acutatum]KAK1726998.1 hypothetical protein BDZ83DRAFT_650070 [Colletotrichum acutatum]
MIAKLLQKLQNDGIKSIEAQRDAEEKWKQAIQAANDRTLMPLTNSWNNGAIVLGKIFVGNTLSGVSKSQNLVILIQQQTQRSPWHVPRESSEKVFAMYLETLEQPRASAELTELFEQITLTIQPQRPKLHESKRRNKFCTSFPKFEKT